MYDITVFTTILMTASIIFNGFLFIKMIQFIIDIRNSGRPCRILDKSILLGVTAITIVQILILNHSLILKDNIGLCIFSINYFLFVLFVLQHLKIAKFKFHANR